MFASVRVIGGLERCGERGRQVRDHRSWVDYTVPHSMYPTRASNAIA